MERASETPDNSAGPSFTATAPSSTLSSHPPSFPPAASSRNSGIDGFGAGHAADAVGASSSPMGPTIHQGHTLSSADETVADWKKTVDGSIGASRSFEASNAERTSHGEDDVPLALLRLKARMPELKRVEVGEQFEALVRKDQKAKGSEDDEAEDEEEEADGVVWMGRGRVVDKRYSLYQHLRYLYAEKGISPEGQPLPPAHDHVEPNPVPQAARGRMALLAGSTTQAIKGDEEERVTVESEGAVLARKKATGNAGEGMWLGGRSARSWAGQVAPRQDERVVRVHPPARPPRLWEDDPFTCIATASLPPFTVFESCSSADADKAQAREAKAVKARAEKRRRELKALKNLAVIPAKRVPMTGGARTGAGATSVRGVLTALIPNRGVGEGEKMPEKPTEGKSESGRGGRGKVLGRRERGERREASRRGRS
ncbi:hypothetical protein IAT38_008270 [Cryptococcus sp. DSM 104549]